MNCSEIKNLINQIKVLSALVIGDPCLDEIAYGRVDTIAKEAPVPAIIVDEVIYAPGQAANVAANLASLGVQTTLSGFIGDDVAGAKLEAILESKSIRCDFAVTNDNPTIHRIKYTCRQNQRHEQHVFHAYFESRVFAEQFEQTIIDPLSKKTDLVIVSDYGGGVVSPNVLDAVRRYSSSDTITVGTARGDLRPYSGFNVIIGNMEELDFLIAEKKLANSDLASYMKQAREILECDRLVITAAADGMYAICSEGFTHIKSFVRDIVDITGAGDTATAAFGAAKAANASTSEAALFASLAAAVVVEKPATAVALFSEIIDMYKSQD